MHSICIIRQIVAGISIISQFHKLFESNFWRNFAIWPNCAASAASLAALLVLAVSSRRTGRELDFTTKTWRIHAVGLAWLAGRPNIFCATEKV